MEEEIKQNQETQDTEEKEREKKKNIFSIQWLKIPAMLLCIISVFGMIFGGLGMILTWENNLSADDTGAKLEEVFLEAYGNMLLWDSGLMGENKTDELDGLDGGSIRYTVTSQKEGQKETVLYSNDDTINRQHCRLAVTGDLTRDYRGVYNTDSFLDMIESIANGGNNGEYSITYSEDINRFVYAKDQGLFYCHAGKKYFLIPEFVLQGTGEQDGSVYYYQLTRKNGTYFYACDEVGCKQKITDNDIISQWINGEYEILLTEDGSGFTTIKSSDIPKDSVMIYGKDYSGYEVSLHDNALYYHPEAMGGQTVYSVYLDLGGVKHEKILNNGVKDYFADVKMFSAFFSGMVRYYGILLVGSFAVFLFSFCYLLAAAGKRDEENRPVSGAWDKVPLEVYTIAIGGLFVLLAGGFMAGVLGYMRFLMTSPAICIAGVAVLVCLWTFYWMSITVRIRTKTFWRYTLLYYLFRPVRTAADKMRSNLPFFVKWILALTGVSFLEICVLSTWDEGFICTCFLGLKIMEYLALIHILYQVDQIDKGAMRIAAGNYSQPVQTKKMLRVFRRIAKNINHVSDGISVAVEEKMKSERFKTELITNVSHDIKTPLTSIINYVDLIKKEEIESPVMQEYVEVLDRQSQRLKKLIEDLMEASKASTGNLPVHMELCDATVMLTQVIGEFKERAEANQLELVVESPKPPVNIMADGRHLWRVIDNLMSNICKYAMPGTRVYINLEQFHGMVIMTFRNISKSKLNISSEELMERFVRGDSSRNTEGSGLGLSIAQSLTGLMNGNMAVQIDGDLFKAIVSFEQAAEM